MNRTVALSLFFFLGPLCALALADRIYLKNGGLVEGNILTCNGSQYYVAIDGAQEPSRIDFSNIERMELNAKPLIQASVKKLLKQQTK